MKDSQVRRAIEYLGQGFASHKANSALRTALNNGELDQKDFYRQLLRLAYRMVLLFVAEDREQSLDSKRRAAPQPHWRQCCFNHLYCAVASGEQITDDTDLWQSLSHQFAGRAGTHRTESAPGLLIGTCLWAGHHTPHLLGPAQVDAWRTEYTTAPAQPAMISNPDLSAAVDALAIEADPRTRRLPVDFKNLGGEMFCSAFEPLLELRPLIDLDATTSRRIFTLEANANAQPKTTGSYYTPHPLVQSMVEATIDPVLDQQLQGLKTQQAREKAILDLKVCDPACGSGRFLCAAARRLANRLTVVRTGRNDATPIANREAFRDVIRRCIYAVDIDHMAVDMCMVALWIECLDSDTQPNSLEAHVKVGNALLGTTPALMGNGIPDKAFKPLTGNDTRVCQELQQRNRREQQEIPLGQYGRTFAAFCETEPDPSTVAAVGPERLPDEGHHDRAPSSFGPSTRSLTYQRSKCLADAWCASFMGRKDRSATKPHCITGAVLARMGRKYRSNRTDSDEQRWIRRLAGQHQFFHWHLAFPDVLRWESKGEAPSHERCGWWGGFDIVLGNPPWGAAIADRARPLLRHRFESSRRGTIDTFALFTELATQLLRSGGFLGMVLPDVLLLKNHPDLRLLLLKNTSILELAHWGRPFPKVNLDVASLVARRTPSASDHQIRCIPKVRHNAPVESGQHLIAQATFLRNKQYRFNLRLSKPLMLLLDSARSLGPPMNTLFTLREGVHSGNVRSKLFLDAPSGAQCQPLIFGRREISAMQLHWAGKFIQRDASNFDRGAGEYFNVGDPALHTARKLLVRRTGDHVLAAVDSEGRFCSNNFFLCVPMAQISWPRVLYVCALLNSRFATWFFQSIQPRVGKLFAELKITHLEDIPIPFGADAWAERVGHGFIALLANNPSRSEVIQHLTDFNMQLTDRIHAVSRGLANELRGYPQSDDCLPPGVANEKNMK